MEASKGDSNVN